MRMKTNLNKWVHDRLQDVRHLRPQLLDLHHQIRDDIVAMAQPLTGGRRGFPHKRVHVEMQVSNASEQAVVRQYWNACDGLTRDVADQLKAEECVIPDGFLVTVEPVMSLDAVSAGHPYKISFPNAADAGASGIQVPIAATNAFLEVKRGVANQAEYRLERGTVCCIGRLATVRLPDGGIRTNQIAFKHDAIGTTVARNHARVEWDAAVQAFVVLGETTRQSTTSVLMRNNSSYPLSATGRGIRLIDGDELKLGEAIIQFREVPAPREPA